MLIVIKHCKIRKHLQELGLSTLWWKMPCYLDLKMTSQFIHNYNSLTNTTRIEGPEGQVKEFIEEIDADRSALTFQWLKNHFITSKILTRH